jgi:hypothetical protein
VNTTGVCGNKVHVPIRDSKLTHLLRDDLMGGAEMCLIASLCGLKEQAEETYSTLNFALRAMRVQTTSPVLSSLVTRAAAAELVPAGTPAEMVQQLALVNQKLYQENQELKAALWEREGALDREREEKDRVLDREREERKSEERQRGRDIQERRREGESFNRNGNSSTRDTESIERAWGERESLGGQGGRGGGGRGGGALHLQDRYMKSRGSTPDLEISRRHSYETGSNLSPRVSPGDVHAFQRSGFMEEPGSSHELGGYRKGDGGRGEGRGGGGGGGGGPSYSREGATWDLGLDSPGTSSLPMALSVLETKERPPLTLDPDGYAESPGMRATQERQMEGQREGQRDEILHSRSLVVNERWEEKEKILVLKFTHIIGKMQQEIARLHSSKEIVLQDSR